MINHSKAFHKSVGFSHPVVEQSGIVALGVLMPQARDVHPANVGDQILELQAFQEPVQQDNLVDLPALGVGAVSLVELHVSDDLVPLLADEVLVLLERDPVLLPLDIVPQLL